MFTQSVPAPAPAPSSTGLHVASSTSPASPTSRTSRLRGLSYLRNYTQSHLLNREHGGGGGVGSSNINGGPPYHTGVPAAADIAVPVSSIGSIQSSNSPDVHGSSLVRSESYPSRATPSSADPVFPLLASISASGGSPPARASVSGTSAIPLIVDTTTSPTTTTTTTTTITAAVPTAATTAHTVITMDAAAAPSHASTTTAPMTRIQSATEANVGVSAGNMDSLPSIRFSTFYDPRSTRPSLKFATTSRTLPTGKEVIRVGRYSERDSLPNPNPNAPSAAHVGFKSKVVSRRHCEFWYENSRWYIKDVKSSSGTFLNHIRLSQPGTESKPFPVNDGDIVQLGIDFKGGEEMIFRCVKIRIELNRGWQNKLNAFNMNTHKRLRNMTKPNDGDAGTQSSQDCSICLNSIAPCQSLFVAPCSHTWHYKCVRSLLDSPQYPGFICPNCRAAVDLEADVEDPPEEWDQADADDAHEAPPEDIKDAEHHVGTLAASETHGQLRSSQASAHPSLLPLVAETADLAADTTMQADLMQVDITPLPPPAQSQQQHYSAPEPHASHVSHVSHATSDPVPIPLASVAGRFISANTSDSFTSSAAHQARTPSPTADNMAPHGHDGPITPRNDAGPWVFDGSGIRVGGGRPSTDSRRGEMRSLDTAAAELVSQPRN